MTSLTSSLMRRIFVQCGKDAGVELDDVFARRDQVVGIGDVRMRAFDIARRTTNATIEQISNASGFGHTEVSSCLRAMRIETSRFVERMDFLYGLRGQAAIDDRQAADLASWRRLGRKDREAANAL